jgi:aminocarboxymuconate-semialdehyde decarboxylase
MEDMCCVHEGRLYYFAVLPLTAPLDTILDIIKALRSPLHCRGVVMGYAGLEPGIDDPSFVPVLKALAKAKLPILIHPNYGLPKDVFGPCFGSHGQVLPVSLGFTTGTTIAFTRMYLANISDLLPVLQIILLHQETRYHPSLDVLRPALPTTGFGSPVSLLIPRVQVYAMF